MPLKLGDPIPPEQWVGTLEHSLNLDALYRDQAPRLTRFFARRVAADDVLDMVHEAFQRLLGITAERKTSVICPQAYLSRVADNMIRDRRRRSQFRATERHEPFDEDMIDGVDPLGLLESRDEISRVDSALLALKPRTREIFLLHRLGGHSYAEIAAARGLSVKGVEKQIAKALYELRQRLRPHE